MIQKFKITLILLVLNALALLVLFFLSNAQFKSLHFQNNLATNITSITDGINSMHISGSVISEPIYLNKEGLNWSIKSPIQWPANNFTVNQIIHQLNLLKETSQFSFKELIQTNQSLSDYGLDEPSLVFEIKKTDQELKIIIGNTTALGNKLYLYLPQKEMVYIVSNNLYDTPFPELDNLKQKQIINIPSFEIDALNYQVRTSDTSNRGLLSVRIEKRENDNTWYFKSPLKTQADSGLVLKTIKELTSARVKKFLPPEILDSEMLGFDNPSMKLTLEGNKRRATLILGNTFLDQTNHKNYYAKLESNDSVFTVNSKSFDRFIEADKALREKNFVNFLTNKTTTIDITNTQFQTKLQQLENGAWQSLVLYPVNKNPPSKADQVTINDFLDQLRNLRAVDFFSDNPKNEDLHSLGFNQPIISIALFNKETPMLSLSAAPHPQDRSLLLIHLKNGSTIYSVEKALFLKKFVPNPLHYKDRLIEKLPLSAEIIGLEIEDISQKSSPYLLNYRKDESPGKIPEELLEVLKKITVRRYLERPFNQEERDDDGNIIWRYRLTFKILLPGDRGNKTENRVYYIGNRITGSIQLGADPKQNLVFEFSPKFLQALYPYISEFKLTPESLNEAPEYPQAVEPLNLKSGTNKLSKNQAAKDK